MNTIEHILGSVVAVSTTGYPKKFSPSLTMVPRSADEFTVGEALGLISGQWIYTCAHLQDTFSMMPGQADLFAAWCMNDPEITRERGRGYFWLWLLFCIRALAFSFSHAGPDPRQTCPQRQRSPGNKRRSPRQRDEPPRPLSSADRFLPETASEQPSLDPSRAGPQALHQRAAVSTILIGNCSRMIAKHLHWKINLITH